MKSLSKKQALLLLIVLLFLCIGSYIFFTHGTESTDDATLETHVVSMRPKISGYITQLNINDNQYVKEGSILLHIDTTDYVLQRDHVQAQLEAMKASYEAARYHLASTQISAPANIERAQAEWRSAYARWRQARHTLKRLQHLSNEARSREQLDEAIATEQIARSHVVSAHAQLRIANTASNTIAASKAKVAQLAAQMKEIESALAQAKQALSDTTLIAPIDGYITKRGVEKGDYVQPGQPLFYIVGTPLWVIANFKETQVKYLAPGQKAIIRIDAFPNTHIEGKVDSIQAGTGERFSAFPPENATGNFVKIVQRIPVKITLTTIPDPQLALGPGLSVVPTVYTQS